MRILLLALALIASPALAQVGYPPSPTIDTSQIPTKSEVQTAKQAADTAAADAAAAKLKADQAAAAASSAVKSVNGATPNVSGAVTVPVPDTSALATKAEVQAAATVASNAAAAASTAASTASTAQTAASTAVKTINGAAPNASGALTLAIPTASTVMPPCISDVSAAGTAGTMQFAPFNHTHCSKARKSVLTSAADGTVTFNYSATPFTNPPVCAAVAEVAAGVTDVINVQIIGTPTINSASFLVNRTQRSVVSLIGLTVLSVPAQPGVTKVHAICLEP